MKKSSCGSKKNDVYRASRLFSGLFYGSLVVWTGVCVWLVGSKALSTGWPLGQLLMIAFVLAYTWYFSLGISYKIGITGEGEIQLTSFRKIIPVKAVDIEMLEGPRFGLPFGFIRFRLEREKAYLFCLVGDSGLQRILSIIRSWNPNIKVKYL